MKKILSVFISAIIIILNLFCICTGATEDSADDLYAKKKSLITALGIYNDDYNDEMLITRAMAANFVVRLHNSESPSVMSYEKNPYTDVDSSSPYFAEIMECYNMGYMVGFGNNTFMPDETITYEHFFKVMACCAGYKILLENTSLINVIAKLRLDSGLSGYSSADSINMHDAVTVMYNMLNCEVMVADSFGDKQGYSTATGETVLHYYFDIR